MKIIRKYWIILMISMIYFRNLQPRASFTISRIYIYQILMRLIAARLHYNKLIMEIFSWPPEVRPFLHISCRTTQWVVFKCHQWIKWTCMISIDHQLDRQLVRRIYLLNLNLISQVLFPVYGQELVGMPCQNSFKYLNILH